MSQEIAQALGLMSSDMRVKLGSYYTSLQHRYGDPRVYAMQEEAMRVEQAAIGHHSVVTRADALRSAYDHNRSATRVAHDLRMKRHPATRPE